MERLHSHRRSVKRRNICEHTQARRCSPRLWGGAIYKRHPTAAVLLPPCVFMIQTHAFENQRSSRAYGSGAALHLDPGQRASQQLFNEHISRSCGARRRNLTPGETIGDTNFSKLAEMLRFLTESIPNPAGLTRASTRLPASPVTIASTWMGGSSRSNPAQTAHSCTRVIALADPCPWQIPPTALRAVGISG